jgi:4-diphosphocytidyl-2-C-methyl-D-erythritol kinase
MIERQSPAKINLHLRIAAPGADGFHPLLSWMNTVGLFDTLKLRRGDAIALRCDDPALPTDGRNLVVRAAEMLRRDAEANEPSRAIGGASLELLKRIPAGGGLGGGSGNAATTLSALNDLWSLRLPVERLHAIAATLGSDVAFFLFAPSAICTGRGEIVRPIASPAPRRALLVLPPIAMPTPAVYRRFDALLADGVIAAADLDDAQAAGRDPRSDFASWCTLSAADLLQRLVNDLEAPAFSLEPRLGELRASLQRLLGRVVRMSGSGSTLFTLYDDPLEADRSARVVQQSLAVPAVSVDLSPPPPDRP